MIQDDPRVPRQFQISTAVRECIASGEDGTTNDDKLQTAIKYQPVKNVQVPRSQGITNESRRKPVIGERNGVETRYPSIEFACQATGIDHGSLHRAIKEGWRTMGIKWRWAPKERSPLSGQEGAK